MHSLGRPVLRFGATLATTLATIAATIGLGVLAAPTATADTGCTSGSSVVNGDGSTTVTFGYTGASQCWTVPDDVVAVDAVVLGAGGGLACFSIGGNPATYSYGGVGGLAAATLAVPSGASLAIEVGGTPSSVGCSAAIGRAGGYNGGGNGRCDASHYPGMTVCSGGGGGASDIRVGGTGLADRTLVAGGGGGGAIEFPASGSGWVTPGGAGGGSEGNHGGSGSLPVNAPCSADGPQYAAGGGSADDDRLVPGSGANASSPYTGGGGGGWYGGDVLIYANPTCTAIIAGGGGGSGHADSVSTSNATLVAGGGLTGGGQVRLTYKPLAPVTAAAPTFAEWTCSANVPVAGGYAIPTQTGVSYQLETQTGNQSLTPGAHTAPNGSSVTIDAVADSGYVLHGTTTWTHDYDDVDCAQTQTIDLTAPDSGAIGGSDTLSASGGGSNNPVAISLDPTSGAGVCTLSGTTVSYAKAGDCIVDADQAGDDSHVAAHVQHTIAVGKATAGIGLTVTPTDATTVGKPVHLVATLTPAANVADPTGSVTFTQDGNALPDCTNVPIGNDDTARCDSRDLAAHTAAIAAHYNGDDSYAEATSTDVTHQVDKRNSLVTVESDHNPAQIGQAVTFTAHLNPGPIGGTVQWYVDDAAYGKPVPAAATLTLGPLSDLTVGTHTISAHFSGDAAATAASGSIVQYVKASPGQTRHNPTLRVTVRQTAHHGWYRTPVTISYTCTAHGSPLVGSCPGPVTVRANGHHTVVRTIHSADGGTATVRTRIAIDRTAPTVRLAGAKKGHTYPRHHAPRARCVARDRLSGVASCQLTRTVEVDGGYRVVHYTLTATDRAGNVTIVEGSYRIRR